MLRPGPNPLKPKKSVKLYILLKSLMTQKLRLDTNLAAVL